MILEQLDLERSVGEPAAFYPPVEPYNRGRLRVSELHELYFEEVGNPDGKPAVLLHGGPGAGVIPLYRQAFDPRRYRLVLFDQRGCGRSTPRAELRQNTTWDIVADIERLRAHLRIERWLVFGGSWGGTLALAYAERHARRVTELVLRGVSLWRRSEIDWMYGGGAGHVFPEQWEQFVSHIPVAEQGDLVGAYYRRLGSANATERRAAARQWGAWESCLYSLVPNPSMVADHAHGYEEAMALMECHFIREGAWLENDSQLLDEVHKIRHIPAIFVFGRYDMITPMVIGWDLKKAWPEAELVVIPDNGHAFNEPGIATALVAATDYFAKA